MNLVIFDIETTGFSPYSNEIIQIAAVKIRAGCLEERALFSTFVRPEEHVPRHITNITGITQEHVQAAPSATEALISFSRFVDEDAILIAHNAVFDMGFIRESCTRHGLAVRDVGVMDSLDLSRKIWGKGVGHSLDDVMERLQLSSDDARRHDARGDVQILAEAVHRMWRQITPDFTTFPVSCSRGIFPSANNSTA
jgi:DNA polymerase III epsilon subunit family exonuclease